MKLNAVGVSSKNLKETVRFYSSLGFTFPAFTDTEQHLEAIVTPGSSRLMIDNADLIKDIIGEQPKPGNHSSFAIEYESASKLNTAADKIKSAGFSVIKEPWDAFWGQRYAIVADPDGYRIDLYAPL